MHSPLAFGRTAGPPELRGMTANETSTNVDTTEIAIARRTTSNEILSAAERTANGDADERAVVGGSGADTPVWVIVEGRRMTETAGKVK